MVIAPEEPVYRRLGADTDKYELITELDHGSMSNVYLARSGLCDNLVVVKLIHEFFAQDLVARAQFQNEALILQRIKSEHVIRYVSHGGMHITTEFFDGINFKKMLFQNRIEPLESKLALYLTIMIQAAQGLSDSHALVVHRDVKPANLIVSNGSVRLCDFGIATFADTVQPYVVGTPLYMSPEAIRNEATDKRTDIYGFGVILYEVIAGECPFTVGNIEHQHVHKEPVPPSKKLHSIAGPIQKAVEKLEAITLKCLAKKPEDRFQSMGEVKAELIEAVSFFDDHGF